MNASFDLVLDRCVDITPAQAWRGWTDPSVLVHWFTPAPWKTLACDIDLRPGGRFHTVMRGPDPHDADVHNEGCYLEVVPQRRLVWTNALGPGFRPLALAPEASTGFLFTATLEFLPDAGSQASSPASGCRFVARLAHADAASRARHESMGFEAGWTAALEQLVAWTHQHDR
jgi:uncharacterized protein YndB with AHSA1/START domain